MITPPTYPARPRKGGPLPVALDAGLYGSVAPRLHQAGVSYHPWRFEPKVNGWRAIVHVPTGMMWNRHGKPLSIEGEFTKALNNLAESPFTWLDIEGLDRRHGIGKGSLIVLDWITPFETYRQRRIILEEYFNCFSFGMEILISEGDVHLIPAHDPRDGGWMFLWDALQKFNADLSCTFYEGIVAKRGDSTYPMQLRSDDEECTTWVKHRFTTAP
jgi:hypothetical protein